MASKKDDLRAALNDYSEYDYKVFNILWDKAKARIQQDLNSEYLNTRRYQTIDAGDEDKEYLIELPNEANNMIDIWVVNEENDERIEKIQPFTVEKSNVSGIDQAVFIPDGIPNETRIEIVFERYLNDDDSDQLYDIFFNCLLLEASQYNRDIEMYAIFKNDYNDSIIRENSEYYIRDTFINNTFN